MAAPTLLICQGKPLPLGLSQSDDGFNLAVCQDNEISWYRLEAALFSPADIAEPPASCALLA